MSMATYEQRLQALEAAVADLRSQQSARETSSSGASLDHLPRDAEQPLIPGLPPKTAVGLRAKLTGVEHAPQGLGLSPSEWAALNLEEVDE
jgi:hypothetical protein